MSPKVKRMFKAAKADKEFIATAQMADPNWKVPGLFSDELEKHICAVCYYGWLLHKNPGLDPYDLV